MSHSVIVSNRRFSDQIFKPTAVGLAWCRQAQEGWLWLTCTEPCRRGAWPQRHLMSHPSAVLVEDACQVRLYSRTIAEGLVHQCPQVRNHHEMVQAAFYKGVYMQAYSSCVAQHFGGSAQPNPSRLQCVCALQQLYMVAALLQCSQDCRTHQCITAGAQQIEIVKIILCAQPRSYYRQIWGTG
jgi:hypothetical protein